MNTINYKQNIPISLSTCWDFFSSPSNLPLLTPPYLGFSNDSSEKSMYEGQIISHRIKPVLGISILWVTEITHVKPLEYFIDEQRFGPYKFWHHEHRFREIPNGVEITDIIHYMVYGGIFGKLINNLKISKDLEAIFSYRQNKIRHIFGVYNT